MLSRIIEVCARNRFLVFTAVLLLTLAGIWSLQHVPLDALPDISDVQVIIHTAWEGEPPDVIEDQVTYPIVTAMLAAPHVKAVRAQTMPNDSYCSSCSKMAPISIGHAAACSNISSRLLASFRLG